MSWNFISAYSFTASLLQRSERKIVLTWRVDEREKHMSRIRAHCVLPEVSGTCLNWYGKVNRSGYPRFNITLSGKRFSGNIYVARLVYFANNKEACYLDPKFTVSHLCHNKMCVRYEHLTLESIGDNNKRKVCKNTGSCTGHRGGPNCLI